MKILNVVGARPNLMKIAPIVEAMAAYSDIQQILIHTGQHYDERMSQIFFDELGIPRPDVYLQVGSGSHARQTAAVMVAFEDVMLSERPDLVVVVGDVNSTLACTIVAAKLCVPVAHVEAGLRSGDRRMPEEINRILTDSIADYLFTTSADGDANLLREGVDAEKIFRVGNVMIDTLLRQRERALALPTLATYHLVPKGYGMLTLHRPSNVDDATVLASLVDVIARVQEQLPLIFPVHPRTGARLREFALWDCLEHLPRVQLCEPLGYLDNLALLAQSRLVLTDSGGIQEETTALGVPCLTLRTTTERPVTVTEGTNEVVGTDPTVILQAVTTVLAHGGKAGRVPDLWDGHAGSRIVAILRRHAMQWSKE